MPSKNTKKRKHQSRRLLRLAMGTPWAIDTEKLASIGEVLELAANGMRFDKAEINQRIGPFGFAEPPAPRIINGVSVIPYHGVSAPRMNLMMEISGGVSTQLVAKWIHEAAKNQDVKAIVLDVDSPGGSAIGCEELSDLIYSLRGKKPIKAVVTGSGASAAYYVPSACDELIASPSSVIGSIGTLSVFTDTTKAEADTGVKITAIHAGKHKGDGWEGLDPQTRATIQERVDDYYSQFIAAVARNRGTTPKQVEADYGQGKAFIAEKALERGMIDRIARLEEVVAELSGGKPATTHTTPPTPLPHEEEQSVNKKIIAALYACDLIASMEASDEVANAALNAFFAATGATRPETDEAILAALSKAYAPRSAEEQTTPTPNQTQQRPEAEIRAAERERLASIRSSAELLGVDDEQIQAAIDSGDDIEAIRSNWVEEAAKENQPLQREEITGGDAAYDKFTTAALDALLHECDARTDEEPLSSAARELANAGIMGIARKSLLLQGARLQGNNEDIAAQFLALGGHYSVGSMEASYNRSGDYPNLLSGLMGKILDSSIDLAEATYSLWTAKLQDIADFKPKPIVAIGQFDELDERGEDEKAAQLTLAEEMSGWIQIDPYAGKFGLTSVMVANDDLDSFAQGLRSMMIAHENTINRLCLNIVTGNITLLDGNNLFSSAHGNDVTSGGIPSATQLSEMRKKHRQQSGVGGKGKVKTKPSIVLAPTALETSVEQVLSARLIEHKTPQTDATVNTFRGTMRHVIEPDLDDYSETQWYTLADPRVRRTIVHAFQRGYGRGGKRNSFYDPDAETRWVKLEGRFAAAVSGYRGIVRNAGS